MIRSVRARINADSDPGGAAREAHTVAASVAVETRSALRAQNERLLALEERVSTLANQANTLATRLGEAQAALQKEREARTREQEAAGIRLRILWARVLSSAYASHKMAKWIDALVTVHRLPSHVTNQVRDDVAAADRAANEWSETGAKLLAEALQRGISTDDPAEILDEVRVTYGLAKQN